MSKGSFVAWWDAATPEAREKWIAFDDASWKELRDALHQAEIGFDEAKTAAKTAYVAAKEAAWAKRNAEMREFARAEDAR